MFAQGKNMCERVREAAARLWSKRGEHALKQLSRQSSISLPF